MVKLKPRVSVVIPVWNGEKLLKKNLPPVFEALPENTEVIIIDDGSTDDSVEFIKSLTSSRVHELKKKKKRKESNSLINNSLIKNKKIKIELIRNRKNRGFIYSCNRGVKEARGEFVLLLNTDVVPQKDFLKPALKLFEDKEVFAVSLAEQDYGWAKIWWRGGFIHIGDGGKSKDSHVCAWASGGTGVFRKEMWQKLGGFDPLYSPYYWEDFDLGYRAWKAGYKIIWEPKAMVEHPHESTISKLNHRYVSLIKERNQLLFIWKNIDDFWLKLSHPFGLLLRVLTGPNYLKVIWAAWKQYRRCGKPKAFIGKFTDKQVISLFK